MLKKLLRILFPDECSIDSTMVETKALLRQKSESIRKKLDELEAYLNGDDELFIKNGHGGDKHDDKRDHSS